MNTNNTNMYTNIHRNNDSDDSSFTAFTNNFFPFLTEYIVEEKLNHIDAICQYCEMNEIEVESVSKLISKSLKERLKYDAISLNFMKKTSRAKLPL